MDNSACFACLQAQLPVPEVSHRQTPSPTKSSLPPNKRVDDDTPLRPSTASVTQRQFSLTSPAVLSTTEPQSESPTLFARFGARPVSGRIVLGGGENMRRGPPSAVGSASATLLIDRLIHGLFVIENAVLFRYQEPGLRVKPPSPLSAATATSQRPQQSLSMSLRSPDRRQHAPQSAGSYSGIRKTVTSPMYEASLATSPVRRLDPLELTGLPCRLDVALSPPGSRLEPSSGRRRPAVGQQRTAADADDHHPRRGDTSSVCSQAEELFDLSGGVMSVIIKAR